MTPIRVSVVALWLLTAGAFLPRQSVGQFARVGVSTVYDYDVALPSVTGYAPYGRGQTSLYGAEVHLGLSIGFLSFYPTYAYAVGTRAVLLANESGDYLPLGYGFSREAGTLGEVTYGPEYFDLGSEAHLEQTTRGTYVFLRLGGGLEVGSGRFVKTRTVTVYSDVLVDEYYLLESDGQEDHYLHWDTWRERTVVDTRTTSARSIPLSVQWTTSFGGWYGRTRVTQWRTDHDRSYTIEYGIGVTL